MISTTDENGRHSRIMHAKKCTGFPRTEPSDKIRQDLFLRIAMKTVAYLRVSTGGQDLAHQKLAILDYARRHRFTVAQFVEAHLSSRRARQREQILQAIEGLHAGDRLIVSELSRLGR